MPKQPTYDALARRVQELERELSELKSEADLASAAETSFRRMVQAANSVVLTLDPAGTITFINDYGLAFFGYEKDEVIGCNAVGTIVPETDRNGSDLAAMITALVREPEKFTVNENENVKKSGQRVWLAWTNRAVRTDDGSLDEIICVGNDITARREAERKLEETTCQLRERIKELDCIYSISRLRDRTDFSLDETLQAIVDLIPPSFQYPKLACARIVLEGYEIATDGFTAGPLSLDLEVRVGKQKVANLEVCYRAAPPHAREDPFLEEERSLLEVIAERIGKIIEREWMEEDIRRLT
jgi:PAS domain S-box-containing protein